MRPSTVVDRRAAAIGPPLLALALALLAWQTAVALTELPTVLAPTPGDVLAAFLDQWPVLLSAAGTTALTAAGGLAIGVLLGGAIAFSAVNSRRVAGIVVPYLLAARIAPLIALAPLVFFWLGDGVAARTVLVGTMTPFPIALATYDGLQAVPEPYLDLSRSVAASDRTTFLRVRVPAAAGSIRAGVQLAGSLAVIGAVVAEFLALDGGLGFRIYRTAQLLDTPGTIATLLVVSAVGVCFYTLPARPLRRWV